MQRAEDREGPALFAGKMSFQKKRTSLFRRRLPFETEDSFFLDSAQLFGDNARCPKNISDVSFWESLPIETRGLLLGKTRKFSETTNVVSRMSAAPP
jgi:hypothetical protein